MADDFASWDVPLDWWDRPERDHEVGDVVVLEGVSSSRPDLVVDAAPGIPHDPDDEFVVLSRPDASTDRR